MAWPWLTLAAKAIPWTALVRRAPEIIDASARLLAMRKAGQAAPRATATSEITDAELRERLRVLESQDRENARVVEQLAEQVRDLTQGVEVLAARLRILLVVVAAAILFAAINALALLW
jgi:hypothetical protein